MHSHRHHHHHKTNKQHMKSIKFTFLPDCIAFIFGLEKYEHIGSIWLIFCAIVPDSYSVKMTCCLLSRTISILINRKMKNEENNSARAAHDVADNEV